MGYIGDEEMSAPALSEVSLERSEAAKVFDRVLYNLDIFLKNERIHGDLSAYNILYWDGDISIIDFPQVVSPHVNKDAFTIFQRDVKRVCDYFAKQGVKSDAQKLAEKMWSPYGYQIFEPEVME